MKANRTKANVQLSRDTVESTVVQVDCEPGDSSERLIARAMQKLADNPATWTAEDWASAPYFPGTTTDESEFIVRLTPKEESQDV